MSQIVKLPEGTRGEVLRFSTVPDVPLLQSICPKNTLRNVGIKCLKKCWDKVSKCTRTTMILIINIIRETIWTMTMIIRRITIIIIIIIINHHHHHHKKKWFNDLSLWTKAQPHHRGESARRKCRGVHPAETGEVLMSVAWREPKGTQFSMLGLFQFMGIISPQLINIQFMVCQNFRYCPFQPCVHHVILPTLTPNMNWFLLKWQHRLAPAAPWTNLPLERLPCWGLSRTAVDETLSPQI